MTKKLINKIRIVIPTNIGDEIDLANNIIAKEALMGPASPIAYLNWAGQAVNVTDASTHYKKAEALRKESEKELELCKVIMVDIDDRIKQSRDSLKGAYRATPHTLGDWGFVVNESETSGIVKPQ